MTESDDNAKRTPHPAAFCTVQSGDYFLNGSMARHCGQWVPRYTCPACGRQMRAVANYLGKGALACSGDRFWRPHEQTLAKLGREHFESLVKGA